MTEDAVDMVTKAVERYGIRPLAGGCAAVFNRHDRDEPMDFCGSDDEAVRVWRLKRAAAIREALAT